MIIKGGDFIERDGIVFKVRLPVNQTSETTIPIPIRKVTRITTSGSRFIVRTDGGTHHIRVTDFTYFKQVTIQEAIQLVNPMKDVMKAR